jgi:acetyl-CoA carboxylase biotin carboxyl carrier protein
MNIKEIKDLISDILQSDICEFELEHTGTKVRLKRGVQQKERISTLGLTHAAIPAPVPESAVREESPDISEGIGEAGLHFITSPIVGTFCRASSPGAAPFVNVGEVVEEGTVLCIVEAMKLMNEIPSDVTGEVSHIYVENGQPVEFGQKLFGIRPHK